MSGRFRAYLEFFKEMGVEYVRLSPKPQKEYAAAARGMSLHENSADGTRDREGANMSTTAGSPADARGSDFSQRMDEIRDDLGDCVRCKLHRGRTQIVFGAGNVRAELMFVGEAPGADEDEQGVPFVGRAGQLLTRIIESIGLRRDDVYIANIIKCRPPQNRNPEPDEIEKCNPFLLRQISLIQPRIICALGKFAAQTLLGTSVPISQLRGRFFDKFGAKVMPTFHPSYLLRNPAGKREVWEDMKAIRRTLDEPRQGSG